MNEITKPKHYTQGPIECLDAIESMLTGDRSDGAVDFYRAQVVKYLWRMPHKGSPLVDARKADFYLHRLIKKLEERDSD